MKTATLSNWSIRTRHGYICLTGLVYNHPYFPDGKVIVTSPICTISQAWNEVIALTQNTEYLLVNPA